jgi:hypothetical protein
LAPSGLVPCGLLPCGLLLGGLLLGGLLLCGSLMLSAFFRCHRSLRIDALRCFLTSMNFCRGSRCSPPGRQSLPRFSSGAPEDPALRSRAPLPSGAPLRSEPLRSGYGRALRLSAARAASCDSHSFPRAKYFICASGCFSLIR